jgi:hypothetical protein
MTDTSPSGPQAVISENLKNVPVEITSSDTLIPLPANAFAVRFTPEGVLFTFAFAVPPLVTGDATQQKEALDALTSVKARPVADILIPFGRVPYLVQVVNTISEQIQQQGIAQQIESLQ